MTSHERMDARPWLSFIVPAYNCRSTISRCLDSIISQMDVPYEIICVDDGSLDDTPAILDSYAERYASVSVMHVPNNGPSMARTRGIRTARGQYLMFVDSDDYFAAGRLMEVVAQVRTHAAHGIYVFGYLECIKRGTTPKARQSSDGIEGVVALTDFLDVYSRPDNISLMNYLFNKVYRSDIAQSAVFDSSVSLGEDALYNYECYAACDDVFVSRTSAYVYENYSMSSLSRGQNLGYVWMAYRTVLDAIEPLLIGHGLDERLRLLQRSYAISALHEYIRKRGTTEEDKRAVKDILTYMNSAGRSWPLDGVGSFDALLIRCARMGCTSLGLTLCAIKRLLQR